MNLPSGDEKNIYRTFIISISVIVALVLSGIFIAMAILTRQLMNEDNIVQSRIIFNTIVLTRKWNADYGGVYVRKQGNVESNPFLKNPDIRTTDNRIFTLRNPALMTREISEYAEKEGLFKFHITSLKLINPRNKPDEFEVESLRRFEAGSVKEAFRTETIGKRTYFRYMAPLGVEDNCLQCHGQQGYARGDVRGGISISFDVQDQQDKIRRNMFIMLLSGAVMTILLLVMIYYFMTRLIKRLAVARQTIEMIAITDELTGIYNRRYLLSRFNEEFEKAARLGTNLGCIIADIDHFKAVNDTHEHLAGDEVLKEVSDRINRSVRIYDILGRYGGEEFLILLPDTDLEQALNFAERIRMQVKAGQILGNQVTLSLGVTCQQQGDRSIDEMIKRADDALYRAKNAGRDRVVRAPEP